VPWDSRKDVGLIFSVGFCFGSNREVSNSVPFRVSANKLTTFRLHPDSGTCRTIE
jgi:hypothetical protein